MRATSPAAALVAVSLALAACSAESGPPGVYALTVQTLEGESLPLASFQGRPLLVVNVASECGFTPQYAGLQALHERYGERGLVVLGVPSNEFGGQEPGDPAAIRSFCQENYGVTFALCAKGVTAAGPEQSPLYRFLGERGGELPSWNFCKYLVAPDGETVRFFPSKVASDDPELVAAIESLLPAGG